MMRKQRCKTGRMRLMQALCVFLFTLFAYPGFAQVNQTESLTITTYYPAPYGVYKNPRLVPLSPGQEPDCSDAHSAGTMYFSGSDNTTYVCNGNNWVRIGSGGISKLKSLSGHHISPNKCENPISYPEDLCEWDGNWGRYTDVKFSPVGYFTKVPHVIVAIEQGPDPNRTPCDDNRTDGMLANATAITKDGFQIRSFASPASNADCPGMEGWRSRVEVGWLAIGE